MAHDRALIANGKTSSPKELTSLILDSKVSARLSNDLRWRRSMILVLVGDIDLYWRLLLRLTIYSPWR